MKAEVKESQQLPIEATPFGRKCIAFIQEGANGKSQEVEKFCSETYLAGFDVITRKGSTVLKCMWMALLLSALLWFSYEARKVVYKFAAKPHVSLVTTERMAELPELHFCPLHFVDPERMQEAGLSADAVNYGLTELWHRQGIIQEMFQMISTTKISALLKNNTAPPQIISPFIQGLQYLNKTGLYTVTDSQSATSWHEFTAGQSLGDAFRKISFPITDFLHFISYSYGQNATRTALLPLGLCYILNRTLAKLPKQSNEVESVQIWFLKVQPHYDIRTQLALNLVLNEYYYPIQLDYDYSYNIYVNTLKQVKYHVIKDCSPSSNQARMNLLQCYTRVMQPLLPKCKVFYTEKVQDVEATGKYQTRSLPYCSTEIIQSIKFNSSTSAQLHKCDSQTKSACESYHYAPSMTQLVTSPYLSISKGLSQAVQSILTIEFSNAHSILVSIELPSFTYENALSSIGGLFGLFIGGSIISVAHIIYFCIDQKIRRVKPNNFGRQQN